MTFQADMGVTRQVQSNPTDTGGGENNSVENHKADADFNRLQYPFLYTSYTKEA